MKTLYVIAGPTAVGKTAAAIQLAQQLGTEIISADSRQCYSELNIGVARPSSIELSLIKHHFIASHSIFDEVNAAVFETFALDCLSSIFAGNDNAVIVGGTGLYIKALCEGIDYLPQVDSGIRTSIIQQYDEKGISWLQEEVKKNDPLFFSGSEYQNPQRLLRALEVVLQTGRSIRNFQTGLKVKRPFNILKIGLEIPRDVLYTRINQRVDNMMIAGLLIEAETCYQQYVLSSPKNLLYPALNTVGYTELFDYFKGLNRFETAVSLIKQHTRNYAKRQLTWFHKDPAFTWMTPDTFTRRVLPDG